jgi:glutathione peroxidase
MLKKIILSLSLCLTTSVFAQKKFYDLSAKSIKGEIVEFSSFKGKTILFVNIASRCGYTPQLETLQQLYERFRQKDFLIVGVPSNEFGAQSPEADTEMVKFCKLNYGVNFPLLSKSSVKGKNKSPLFKYLIEGSRNKNEISWNFEKFLVNKNGEVIARFNSGDSPLSQKILNKIKKELN